MVRSARVERATVRLEGGCSIQLSYERILVTLQPVHIRSATPRDSCNKTDSACAKRNVRTSARNLAIPEMTMPAFEYRASSSVARSAPPHLRTSRISIAKLLLADFLNDERRKAETRSLDLDDRMTFGQAMRRPRRLVRHSGPPFSERILSKLSLDNRCVLAYQYFQ